MHLATSFLLLVALLVASLLLVAMHLATSSFVLLVAMHFVTSSVLAASAEPCGYPG